MIIKFAHDDCEMITGEWYSISIYFKAGQKTIPCIVCGKDVDQS